MNTQLPAQALRRTTFRSTQTTQQIRHASLLQRPQRPYTFTQLVTLSDGSTYTARTTSPAPIYRSTKDSRNNLKWQPSLNSLRNVELDEAGKLRAFRQKFGRGWDVDALEDEDTTAAVKKIEKDVVSGKVDEDVGERRVKKRKEDKGDSLMDLIAQSHAAGRK